MAGRKYEIGNPETYRALDPFEPKPAAEAEPAKKPPTGKRAVWIVHGMGQQVQFETLDSLTEGIMSVTNPPQGQQNFAPKFRAVKIGDSTVQRVEIEVRSQGTPLELHLYEAYWAPITEGQVKLTDVISFLFDACSRGLINAMTQFKRAIFGEVVGFKIPKRAAAEILAALITLLSLIALNSIIGAAGALRYGLTGETLPGLKHHWQLLTALASSLSSIALTFGSIIFLASLSKPSKPSLRESGHAAVPGKSLITVVVWIAFALTLATVFLGALILGFFAVINSDYLAPSCGSLAQIQAWATSCVLADGVLVGIALLFRGLLRSRGKSPGSLSVFLAFFVVSFALFLVASAGPVVLWCGPTGLPFHLPTWVASILKSPVWVWPFLILLSYEVRELLIQYVGDVAAYVSPNKLDRFCKIRQEIKDLAYKSASAVYLAQDQDSTGRLLYDKIAVIGHSLGSVIAYDTLNKLLNADELAFTSFDVRGRTCLLETFGSPLDKIAFFFTIQGKDAFQIREQLAAVVQPLISVPTVRSIPWVNVYSPNDIIAGKVQLYDSAESPQVPKIHREVDGDAIIPLAAHVEYWGNNMIWDFLCDGLAGRPIPPTTPPLTARAKPGPARK